MGCRVECVRPKVSLIAIGKGLAHKRLSIFKILLLAY